MEGGERNNQVVHDRRPRRFHKRTLALLILSIVIAGALNYPVAWWCLLRTPPWRQLTNDVRLKAPKAQELTRSLGIEPDPQADWPEVVVWRFFGFRHTWVEI